MILIGLWLQRISLGDANDALAAHKKWLKIVSIIGFNHLQPNYVV